MSPTSRRSRPAGNGPAAVENTTTTTTASLSVQPSALAAMDVHELRACLAVERIANRVPTSVSSTRSAVRRHIADVIEARESRRAAEDVICRAIDDRLVAAAWRHQLDPEIRRLRKVAV